MLFWIDSGAKWVRAWVARSGLLLASWLVSPFSGDLELVMVL